MATTATKKKVVKKTVTKTTKAAKHPGKKGGGGGRGGTKKKGSKRRDDGARQLAKASNGKFNVDQIRILRSLKNTKQNKSIDMPELKDRVGIGRDGKYSQSWLTSLKSLNDKKLIQITLSANGQIPKEGGRKKHFYHIFASGKKAIEQVEKLPK